MASNTSGALPPSAPVTAPTTALSTVFNMLAGVNFSQLSDLLEGKDTIQEGVTTAEELAGALVQGLTIIGVPFAGTAAALLPTAESLINFGLNFLPVGAGIVGSQVTAAGANAPTISTGR
jgi:hypothetical protein